MRKMMHTNFIATETKAYDRTINMLNNRALDLVTSAGKRYMRSNKGIDYKVRC